MSDEVKPTLEDLTECWCGYKAPHARELMLHQLYCDPHNTAPKVIDDQRERIADLEAQLAAAQAEQAENTRLREGGNIHNCEAAEEQISALEKDAGLLDWLADHEAVKNINGVNLSIYETAMCIAYERDVDAEPTVEDYRLALRLMIRTAINAEAAHSGEGE